MSYLGLIFAFLPLILLLWLANVADRQKQNDNESRGLLFLTYGLLAFFWLSLLAVAIFALLMGVAYDRYADIEKLTATYQAQGLDPDMVVRLMQSLPRVGVGLGLLALAGLAILLKPVRRVLARYTSLDPQRAVHTVALSYSLLIFVTMWLTMAIGMDVAAEAITNAPDTPMSKMLVLLWLQNILLAFMAMVGVGWLSRRSLPEVLARLGLTTPRVQDVARGVGLALLSFLLMAPILFLADKLGIGVDPDIEKISEQLLGPLTSSWFGIISLGFAAALGEELVYRGALQPRFGIFLTALLFSFTHNQYGISVATLVVFVLGLILGWARKRYNTTTSIFLHATYNIIIGISASFLQ